MGFDKKDKLFELLDLDEDQKRSSESRESAADKIVAKAKSRQSSGDLLEFGLVKIWTIILEFFSVFYVHAQKRKAHAHGGPNGGNSHEL